MKKFIRLTMLCSVPFWVLACQTKPNLTKVCDVLVPINPKPETNSYLVANDRDTALNIARHRGRYAQAGCEKNN